MRFLNIIALFAVVFAGERSKEAGAEDKEKEGEKDEPKENPFLKTYDRYSTDKDPDSDLKSAK